MPRTAAADLRELQTLSGHPDRLREWMRDAIEMASMHRRTLARLGRRKALVVKVMERAILGQLRPERVLLVPAHDQPERQLMSIEWFDCNCSFGFPAIPVFRYAATADDLLEEMHWCGIDRALVYHASMRFDSPVVGNQRVLEGVAGRRELMPTWAILPCQTGEFPHPNDLLSAMAANGVRALRAFPNEHRYALDALTFKDLMLALQDRCIPLFAKLDLRGIGRFLSSFPSQVVVAVNQGPHSLERYLRPLLDAYPNLYVDTSYYMVDGLIEEFCARYGSHRLLFGTAYPDNCSGAALLRLAQADISEKDRAAIAGGNLKRLLAEARI